jgi:hypothetical protein
MPGRLAGTSTGSPGGARAPIGTGITTAAFDPPAHPRRPRPPARHARARRPAGGGSPRGPRRHPPPPRARGAAGRRSDGCGPRPGRRREAGGVERPGAGRREWPSSSGGPRSPTGTGRTGWARGPSAAVRDRRRPRRDRPRFARPYRRSAGWRDRCPGVMMARQMADKRKDPGMPVPGYCWPPRTRRAR